MQTDPSERPAPLWPATYQAQVYSKRQGKTIKTFSTVSAGEDLAHRRTRGGLERNPTDADQATPA